MKKSFFVFSLIGVVAIGMSLNSCNKETKPACSYEEGWECFDSEVEKLNAKYESRIVDSTSVATIDENIDLQCKYKFANSGKLMYKVLSAVFNEDFLEKSKSMSDDEVKMSVIQETEKVTGMLNEQLKNQIINADLDELQKTKMAEQYEKVYTNFSQLAMRLSVTDMRQYTEEYMQLINTVLTDKDEKVILTMQCSMMYYINVFWSTTSVEL